jgi:hypothetical protein
VIIQASQLWRYLPSLSFPVDILAEKCDKVVFKADQQYLETLIENGAVIGIGSEKRIKRIRLNTLQEGCSLPLRAMFESFARVDQIKGLPIAGDAIRLLMHSGGGPVKKPIHYQSQHISTTPEIVSVPPRAPYQWPLPRPVEMHPLPGEACS